MRRAIILALLGFVIALVARFPARWVRPLLPHEVHCQQLDGSAWNGSCTGLTNGFSPLGDLSWKLHPLSLLWGRLELQVDLTNQANYLRGDVARGLGGAVYGRNVSMDLALNSALVSSFPAGARARLTGKLASVQWSGKYLSDLKGQLNVQDLVGSQGDQLGSYQAVFTNDAAAAKGDTLTGIVHDIGGPLALDATVQLTRTPGYVLNGHIAARPSASPQIADSLKYLGSPDSQGRRPLTFEGTF